jgi:hypothetical protein
VDRRVARKRPAQIQSEEALSRTNLRTCPRDARCRAVWHNPLRLRGGLCDRRRRFAALEGASGCEAIRDRIGRSLMLPQRSRHPAGAPVQSLKRFRCGVLFWTAERPHSVYCRVNLHSRRGARRSREANRRHDRVTAEVANTLLVRRPGSRLRRMSPTASLVRQSGVCITRGRGSGAMGVLVAAMTEYKDLASMEAAEPKADALTQKLLGGGPRAATIDTRTTW